jgi:hypothetical protein
MLSYGSIRLETEDKQMCNPTNDICLNFNNPADLAFLIFMLGFMAVAIVSLIIAAGSNDPDLFPI